MDAIGSSNLWTLLKFHVLFLGLRIQSMQAQTNPADIPNYVSILPKVAKQSLLAPHRAASSGQPQQLSRHSWIWQTVRENHCGVAIGDQKMRPSLTYFIVYFVSRPLECHRNPHLLACISQCSLLQLWNLALSLARCHRAVHLQIEGVFTSESLICQPIQTDCDHLCRGVFYQAFRGICAS